MSREKADLTPTPERSYPDIEAQIVAGAHWQNFATLCAGEAELFDDPGRDLDGKRIEYAKAKQSRESKAVAICRSGCPVVAHCFIDAMHHGDIDSVRGGMTSKQLKEALPLWRKTRQNDAAA